MKISNKVNTRLVGRLRSRGVELRTFRKDDPKNLWAVVGLTHQGAKLILKGDGLWDKLMLSRAPRDSVFVLVVNSDQANSQEFSHLGGLDLSVSFYPANPEGVSKAAVDLAVPVEVTKLPKDAVVVGPNELEVLKADPDFKPTPVNKALPKIKARRAAQAPSES